MDSRERTLKALDFEEPDRVPVDFWATSGFKRKLKSALGIPYEEFLDLHDVDLRYIQGPAYVGPPLRRFPDGSEEDIWGVRRRAVSLRVGDAVETYREVVRCPLASAAAVEEVNGYGHWPSPDWFDYGGIEAQCEEIRGQGRVVVFMGDRLNRIAQLKPAMYLRGSEQTLLDMSLNPDIAEAILSNIRRFYLAYAERIFSSAGGRLDILLMGDDFGAQNGPLISPGMWVNFLGEGFAEYARLARGYGLRVMHHTCGSVRELIPLMMERGLDILQSLQPEAAGMGAWELKAEYGERLAFHGGISIQRTLPFGTPEDIRSEVRDRVEALAPGGGYILCTSHNIQIDTPVDNVQELLRAYGEYGRYG
jgi:uroporphyrinogen decarboxylase